MYYTLINHANRRGLLIQKSLVTISPAEVLATDVLIGIFWLLLNGNIVSDMLPMLIPEIIGIDGGDDQCRDGDAVGA